MCYANTSPMQIFYGRDLTIRGFCYSQGCWTQCPAGQPTTPRNDYTPPSPRAPGHCHHPPPRAARPPGNRAWMEANFTPCCFGSPFQNRGEERQRTEPLPGPRGRVVAPTRRWLAAWRDSGPQPPEPHPKQLTGWRRARAQQRAARHVAGGRSAGKCGGGPAGRPSPTRAHS